MHSGRIEACYFRVRLGPLLGVDAEAVSRDREPRGCCVVSAVILGVLTFESCLTRVCGYVVDVVSIWFFDNVCCCSRVGSRLVISVCVSVHVSGWMRT